MECLNRIIVDGCHCNYGQRVRPPPPATVHHVLWINITHKKERKGIRYTFLCFVWRTTCSMLCSSAFYPHTQRCFFNSRLPFPPCSMNNPLVRYVRLQYTSRPSQNYSTNLGRRLGIFAGPTIQGQLHTVGCSDRFKKCCIVLRQWKTKSRQHVAAHAQNTRHFYSRDYEPSACSPHKSERIEPRANAGRTSAARRAAPHTSCKQPRVRKGNDYRAPLPDCRRHL